MKFHTPTRYVGRKPYCPTSGKSVFKSMQRGTPEQARLLVGTVKDLFGGANSWEQDGVTVTFAGSGSLWYVIGIRPDDAVWLQLHCHCHAEEVAGQLAAFAAEDLASTR